MFKTKLIQLSTILILGGCVSLEPAYQRPDLPTPQQFSLHHNALVEQTETVNMEGWQTFFNDPQLKQFISTALTHNRDLQTAILNVEEAAQQYRVTNADRYPQLNLSADAGYFGGLTSEMVTRREYRIGMGLDYELDFFGKLKNMSEVERQSFMASQQAQRAAHILVVAQVARSYLENVVIRQQMEIAQRSLQSYQQSLQFIEARNRVGQSTLLGREQARGLVEMTKVDVAKRQAMLARSENALNLLAGQYDLPAVSVTQIDKYQIGVVLPNHLSSDILLQRPDILEAEHQLIAANANIGVARAAFFPSISLTGELSSASHDLSRLFDAASGMWRFMPRIDLPLFDGGRNSANLSLAEIRKELAVVNYEQAIQTAFQEVSDALTARESLQHQITAQQRYLDSLRITLQRANLLYRNGALSYLEVLDTERMLFDVQQDLAELKYNRQVNEVDLFVALGGGWIS